MMDDGKKKLMVKRSNRQTVKPQKAEGGRQQASQKTAQKTTQKSSQKPGAKNPDVMAFIEQSVGQPKAKAGAEARASRTADRAPRPENPSTINHQPSTQRLFFALRVPTNIANPLAEHQRKLKGNWRAVNPGQMHVTLCYLPAVPPERVADLKRLGTRLMQDLTPMHIKLRGTGYFPNEGSPRVWFVKVEAEGLTELADQIRAEVSALGIETEDLPFKAHITLARKKGPAPRIPPITFETGWTATSAALFRSHLRKTGPIYEVESTFRFRGEAADTEVSPVAPSPATSRHPLPQG